MLPLDVMVITTDKNKNPKSIFNRSERIYILVIVTSKETAVKDASVHVDVTRPDFSVAKTLDGTTNGGGEFFILIADYFIPPWADL